MASDIGKREKYWKERRCYLDRRGEIHVLNMSRSACITDRALPISRCESRRFARPLRLSVIRVF